MNQKGLVVFTALTLLTITAPAASRGDVRRETTERRPYIVEIGVPYSISMETLESEARNNSELREYLSNYGYPDYAEIQEIAPDWPWADHEVRIYYLNWNLELDFGHVILSEAMPNLGVRRFLGRIPMSKRHEIEVILDARAAAPAVTSAAEAPPSGEVAPPPPPPAEPQAGGSMEALVARIEAAADRAAKAADRAAEQSEAAVRAADRTVSIVEMLEQSTPPQKPKKAKRARHR
jgi:hypothetical protein